MKYADVGENVRLLLENLPSQDEFIYELLLAYRKPKASITRLKQGTYNQSKVPGEVLWKKEVWFKVEQASRLSDPVPQASRLSRPVDPSDGKQAGRSLYTFIDPDTTKRSEMECHEVTGRSPTSWRGVHMPGGFREAHHSLDLAVDRIYRTKHFTSDEERLEHLFKLYEEMIAKEKLV